MTNIAIIGAGLSGLTAATMLKDHAEVTLFEKARGVGGRMSTRRAEPFFFDHGAQFFKVKTGMFQTCIQPMLENGIIKRWDARFVEIQRDHVTRERLWGKEYPHYVGVPGMNAIGKYLSQGLTIKLGTKVATLDYAAPWQLYDENGNSLGTYDWVICTVPAQQAAELLPQNFSHYNIVNTTKMSGCFSLMLGFDTPLSLPFDAALVRDRDISWISVNSSKPQRPGAFSLLVHSTNQWADAHMDDPCDEVITHLCRETTLATGCDMSVATHKALHGWRYANIKKQHNHGALLDAKQKLAVCGDWCVEGRVEAAFTSGLHTAQAILETL